MKWQPIETAPKNGDTILLYTTDWGVCKGWFFGGTRFLDYWVEPHWSCIALDTGHPENEFSIDVKLGPDGQEDHGTATHWMPLPEPPAQQEQGESE